MVFNYTTEVRIIISICAFVYEYFIAFYCLTYFHFGAEQYATLFLKTYGQYNIRV